MPAEIRSFVKPNIETSIPLTWQNFLKVAYPDADIWAINAGEGWFVLMAKGNTSAILTTERGAVKTYSKLETALDQLRHRGFNQVVACDARETP